MPTKTFSRKQRPELPRNGHLRVTYRLPGWLAAALNAGYAPEIASFFGGDARKKLKDGDVANFLHTLCKCRLFDHCGTDGDGNFVSEPYAANCQICLASAKEFAGRLGVACNIAQPTFHAPGSEAVRITFFKPRGAR